MSRCLSLKLVLFATLATLMIGPKTVSAAGWGAIALSNRTGAFGISNNWNTRAQARQAALNLCRRQGASDCRLRTDFRGCGAIATDPDTIAYGIGIGSNAYQARNNALRRCSQQIPSGCFDARALCNN